MNEDEAKDYIPDKFEEIARKIWGDHIIDQMEIEYQIDSKKTKVAGLASVKSKFSSRKNHGFYKRNIFLANPVFFTYDKDSIDRILIHEAVHLGIHCHDSEFHRKCLEHNGSISLNHLKNGCIKLQIKKGNRFVDLEIDGNPPEFKTTEDAKRYGETYLCQHPDARLRVLW